VGSFLQANANVGELGKRLKQSEHAGGEFQRRIDELTVELQNSNAENQRLLPELARLRILIKEVEDKNDGLARENKQLSGE